MFQGFELALVGVLATALLAGGMAFFSFVFAPLVFDTLEREQASRLIGAAFPIYYLLGLLLAALAAIFVWLKSPADGAVMGAVAAIFALSRFFLLPAIEARRPQRDGDTAADKAFKRLHGLSMLLNLLQFMAVIGVLLRLLTP